jgi:hypothetical protein
MLPMRNSGIARPFSLPAKVLKRVSIETKHKQHMFNGFVNHVRIHQKKGFEVRALAESGFCA